MNNKKIEKILLEMGGMRCKTLHEDKIYIGCSENCMIWWDMKLHLFFYNGEKKKCKDKLEEIKKEVYEKEKDSP